VRVGTATGLVVVGDLIGSGDSQERGIVGETPNLAARLQAIAEPDTVVIPEGTRRRQSQSNGKPSASSVVCPNPGASLGNESAPLGQRGRTSVLVNYAGDEMALLIEMVVDLRVN
jgi:hypothetical protein